MIDTPRTNDFYHNLRAPNAVDSQERSFAATLEHELIEALADASSWEKQAADRADDCIQQINRAERAERDLAAARAKVTELERERDALRADAERYRWLKRLFEHKWGGTIGELMTWHLRGDWRHIVQRLRGHTLDAAIDAAREEK